jgi:hypothetical protein
LEGRATPLTKQKESVGSFSHAVYIIYMPNIRVP